MALYRLLAVAALAANYGSVYADPMPAIPDEYPKRVVTLNVQPIKLVLETPVLVSFFAPRNTDIVIDNKHTVCVTNAPTCVNTVVTKTSYARTTKSSLVTDRKTTTCKHPGYTDPPGTGPTTTTTCVPTVTATPVCASNLPLACRNLQTSDGLELLTTIPLCTVALGTFVVGDTAKCLVMTGITITSKGASIVTCLNNALKSNCITALPAACVALTGLSGANLASNVATCVTALGPLAVEKVLECTTRGLTTGDDIIACLLTTMGLPSGEGSCTPVSPPKACVSALPAPCTALGAITGLGLITELPLCVAALGAYAVGAVTTCLNPANILRTTAGSGIVTCVLTALKGTCITSMPAACAKLATDNAAQLVADIPLCTVALGPFAAGAAAACLTAGGTGQTIVNCLTGALFTTTQK